MPRFKKSDRGKSRIGLIPAEAMFLVGDVLAHGAKKYGDKNWEKGTAWSRYFDALQRHLWAWWSGEDDDPESGLSHLGHAMCCLVFLIAYQARKKGTDDRL